MKSFTALYIALATTAAVAAPAPSSQSDLAPRDSNNNSRDCSPFPVKKCNGVDIEGITIPRLQNLFAAKTLTVRLNAAVSSFHCLTIPLLSRSNSPNAT